jgi:hypothetical protein
VLDHSWYLDYKKIDFDAPDRFFALGDAPKRFAVFGALDLLTQAHAKITNGALVV